MQPSVNGCGPDAWLSLPQWHSRETCNQHDAAYGIGGTESDRYAADRELRAGMMRDAAERPWWQQPWYRLQAQIYYCAVRYNGERFFNYHA